MPKINQISSFHVANRRRHSRMRALNLMKCSVIENGQKAEPWITNVRDLSESGVRFCSDREIKENDLVEVTFNFGEEDRQVPALGSVSWVKSVEAGESEYNEAGISFIELKEDDRDLIRKFMSELQRIETE